MHNLLLVAVLAGLGGMLGWGSADFFAKKTIDVIGDLTTLFWQQLFGVVPLVILFLLNPHVPTLHHYDPLFLIAFGAVSALSYLPLYAGFGKGQVSLLSPIFAAYSVVVVILAAIFLHASVSPLQKLAIIVVFAGIVLLSTDPHELRESLKSRVNRVKGVPEVFSAMIVYSFWLLLLDKFLNGKSWVFYLLVIRCVAVVTLLVYAWVTKQRLKVGNRGLWKFLVTIGVFDVAAYASVSYGYSHSPYVGIVTVLSATFSLPTMLLAYVFLKERIKPLQLAAALVIIGGVVLISIS